jgi:hypothetical protein
LIGVGAEMNPVAQCIGRLLCGQSRRIGGPPMSISVARKIQYRSDGADNPDNPVVVSVALDSER